eukprot:scaffold143229_cov18-Tisochrysis_lutea.AAC.1
MQRLSVPCAALWVLVCPQSSKWALFVCGLMCCGLSMCSLGAVSSLRALILNCGLPLLVSLFSPAFPPEAALHSIKDDARLNLQTLDHWAATAFASPLAPLMQINNSFAQRTDTGEQRTGIGSYCQMLS